MASESDNDGIFRTQGEEEMNAGFLSELVYGLSCPVYEGRQYDNAIAQARRGVRAACN